jgi:acyl-coenzyme A synthetase/AMP-(fatty) acid ligase
MPATSTNKLPHDNPRVLVSETPVAGFDSSRTVLGSDLLALLEDQKTLDIAPTTIESLDEPCWITHTSGTTGRPKGILFSYRSALRTSPYLDENGVEKRMLGFFGLPANAGFSLALRDLRNQRPYLALNPAGENTAEVIEEFEVKELLGSPIQISKFIDNSIQAGRALPEGLEIVRPGGSKSPPQLLAKIHELLKAEIRVSYATTEVGTIAKLTLAPGEDASTVGTLVEGVEAQAVDENDVVLPSGTIGNLRFRKSGMVTEYFENPEATAKAFRDGWFYNGDLGSIDETGQIRLVGRVDDVVNLGGEKVSLTAIEEHALTFPGVKDAACCLLRNFNGLPVIAIGYVSEDDLDQKVFFKILGEEFGLEAPRVSARFLQLPRNENGKLDRLALAREFSRKIVNRKNVN